MAQKIRRGWAQQTLAFCQQGYYKNLEGDKVEFNMKPAVEGTKLYTPDEDVIGKLAHLKVPLRNTLFQIKNEQVLVSTRHHVVDLKLNTCVLNFASARHPGGGFLGGAMAQEESIAYCSGIYPCLTAPQCKTYYEVHNAAKDPLYTNHMIYSPHVPIFREENQGYQVSETCYTASFISAPAPNAGVAQERGVYLAEINGVYKDRLRRLLAIALLEGHDSVVLGAWGCGVFRNDPAQVAKIFREVLLSDLFAEKFRLVTFAIYKIPENLDAFQKAFKDLAEPEGKGLEDKLAQLSIQPKNSKKKNSKEGAEEEEEEED